MPEFCERWYKRFKLNAMSYIVIETFGGAEYAIIVTDEEGNNLVFDTIDEAQDEADECQGGLVVEID